MVGGLWATCLDRPLTEGEEARLLEFLPPERRQRLLRLPRREQRREPLCAYRLLTLALERECGWSTLPPMAHTPFNVASISALWSMGPTRHGVLHSAAESNARCAALLLGGMRTSPLTWAGR